MCLFLTQANVVIWAVGQSAHFSLGAAQEKMKGPRDWLQSWCGKRDKKMHQRSSWWDVEAYSSFHMCESKVSTQTGTELGHDKLKVKMYLFIVYPHKPWLGGWEALKRRIKKQRGGKLWEPKGGCFIGKMKTKSAADWRQLEQNLTE